MRALLLDLVLRKYLEVVQLQSFGNDRWVLILSESQ